MADKNENHIIQAIDLEHKYLPDDEIKEYLKEKGIIDNRGAVIARNELVGAENTARVYASEYLGTKYQLNLVKVWKSNKDDKTCDVCLGMDGQIVAMSAPFDNVIDLEDGTVGVFEYSQWNDDGVAPHAHANCRCWFDIELR